MARPSKRPAESDLEDDVDQSRSSSQEASSTPPSGSRKRRRVSNDSLMEGENPDRNDTPPSEYESDLDEEDEVAATQAIRQKRAEQTENGPAECGILESVKLFNFMCHKKYEFKLGPLINFICGANGSGKSAILTAIVLCLGGKASATNRGGSLKSFIKEGEDSARIICRIKNHGEGAFLPEEYGESIEVERYFTKMGTSGFKLRSDSGRLISSKKADLDEICDHFALQIDNPLNVLSQDMARQFISSSNASEKYRFFIKGVQLEQLDQDYRLIEEQLENIKVNIEAKRPDIKDLERSMEQAQAKDNAMRKKENVRTKLRDIRRQIAWVQVQEQEKILEEYEKEIEQADANILEAEQHVAGLEHAFQTFDTSNGEATEAYNQAQTDLAAARDERKEAELRRDALKLETVDVAAELRMIRSTLKTAESSITTNTKEIGQEERRLLDLQGPGPAQRQQDLIQAKDLAREAKDAWEQHKAGYNTVKQEETTLTRKLQDLSTATDAKRREVDTRRDGLKDFLANHDSINSGYHPKTADLLKAIAQERKFRQKPIGPLGRHVRLLKPEWSSILEKSFGAILDGFIVTSQHDSNILRQVMSRFRYTGPILIGNDLPLNTANHEPDEQFDTVLRVLEIDNDLVRKQLIIQNNIEQSILMHDLDDMYTTMWGGSHGPCQKLRNVRRGYCFNYHNKRKGHVLAYSKTNTINQDPASEWAGKPRMRGDNQAQIRMREEAIEDAQKECREIETEFYQVREAQVKSQQASKRHEKRAAELKIEYQRRQQGVDDIEETAKEDNIEAGRLDVLRAALQEANDNKAITEETYKDAVNSSDNKKAALSVAQSELNAATTREEEAKRFYETARESAAKADKERTYNLGELNQVVARVNDAKNDRTNMDGKRVGLQEKITDYVNQATVISERVNLPAGANQENLEAQYAVMRADLEKFQRQMGGTEAEIAATAKRARDAFKKGKKDLENLETLEGKLTTSLVERRERWKLFRSHISVRAKAMFTYLLSERSFRGRLVTDHKQKLLELSVEPDITKRDGQGRNARTLSGGEKSFSQICLLLSIWEAMGSPIRCLDEFDVFMDAVNRRLSVNLLIEGARQSVGRQFVLISPGTKSDIQKADDINGVEVEKPVRGQRTLDETGIQRNAS